MNTFSKIFVAALVTAALASPAGAAGGKNTGFMNGVQNTGFFNGMPNTGFMNGTQTNGAAHAANTVPTSVHVIGIELPAPATTR